MTDLSQTILAKSDQLNADDLIGGKTLTLEITDVRGRESADQPIDIFFKGDNGKPWKPCKSMRRALVFAWGANGKEYVGRSLTLYRDPEVKFGGIAVGGLRISHMSHIDGPMSFPLTASKGSKKIFSVKPLKTQTPAKAPEPEPDNPLLPEEWYALQDRINRAETLSELEEIGAEIKDLSPRMTEAQRQEVRTHYGTRGKYIRSQNANP